MALALSSRLARGAMLAALFALVVVGVVAARTRRPPADTYAIDLGAQPLDAALWLAEEHPDYFFLEGERFEAWIAGMPEADRALIGSVAASVATLWIEREVERIRARGLKGPGAISREAEGAVRRAMLNQLELDMDRDLLPDAEDAPFERLSWARLARGSSNCDGQNHLLGLMLASFYPAELVRPSGGGHVLVRWHPPGESSPLFVDAWANAAPFVLDDVTPGEGIVSIARLGEADAVAVPGLLTRVDETRRIRSIAWGPMLPELRPMKLEPWPSRLARAEARASSDVDQQSDPRVIYLVARTRELFGEHEPAMRGYRRLADGPCLDPAMAAGIICRSTAIFIKRSEGE